MKKIKILLAACAVAFCSTTFAQNTTFIPDGALIQSVRNDDETALYIPGYSHSPLKMDRANNLHGDDWKFYFVGTVKSLSDITDKPVCQAGRVALKAGCGYVAHLKGGSDNSYVRIYIPSMVLNKSGEIIGATIIYQSPYESSKEKEIHLKELAEKRASEIFWDGTAVPDQNLRSAILECFDTDGNGTISRSEAGAEIECFEISSVSNTDGLEKLSGIMRLSVLNKDIFPNLTFNLPYLRELSYEGSAHSINLSQCRSLESATFTDINCGWLNLNGLRNLKHIYFRNKKYENSVSTLDCSACSALESMDGMFKLNGTKLDLSDCIRLSHIYGDTSPSTDGILPIFKKINLSGCRSIEKISIFNRDYYYKYWCIEELNLAGCSSLNRFYITDTKQKILNLKSLDFSSCTALEEVTVEKQNVGNINFKECKRIISIRLAETDLRTLDLSGKSSLSSINVYDNKYLTKLNVSGCEALNHIYCSYNALNMVDLSGCINLGELFCNDNNLSSLNLTYFPKLELLNCSCNKKLINLTLGTHNSLFAINCDKTAITELDISGCADRFEACENANKLTVPSYREGFRTLYVNKRQTVENEELPLCNKKFNKKSLLNIYIKDRSGEWISAATDEDAKFKIKVKK